MKRVRPGPGIQRITNDAQAVFMLEVQIARRAVERVFLGAGIGFFADRFAFRTSPAHPVHYLHLARL